MEEICLHGKKFKLKFTEKAIQEKIQAIAAALNKDYKDKQPVFISVLNGAFLFTADLLRLFKHDCEIHFIKLASYAGTQSTGKAKEIIGLNVRLTGKHVVVLEDIVDTGKTLSDFLSSLKTQNPNSIEIASLLTKPKARTTENKHLAIKYLGFEIENDFVVGYGLDYDGLGRNYPMLYVEEGKGSVA